MSFALYSKRVETVLLLVILALERISEAYLAWKRLVLVKKFDFGQSQQLRVLSCVDVTLRLTWQDAIRGRRMWHMMEMILACVSAWWCVTERGGA